MACSKLEAMAIYLVKQACGNDKLACVYLGHDEDVSAYGKLEVFKAKEKLNQPSQIEAL